MFRSFAFRCAAAALAAAAGNAHADPSAGPSIALSGQFDVSAAWQRPVTGAAGWSLASGNRTPSHLAIAGDEDLGGGGTAFFRLDTSVALQNGTVGPVLWNRESVVGLRQGPVTVAFGRNVNPFFDTVRAVTVFGEARMAPLFAVVGYTTSHPLNPAQDNAVRVDVAGTTVHGALLLRVRGDADTRYGAANAEVRSDDGRRVFRIAADRSEPVDRPGRLNSLLWGGGMDLGTVRLQVAGALQRDTGAGRKSRGLEVGASWPLAGRTVLASVSRGTTSDLGGNLASTIDAAALGLDWPLSPRTALYAIVSGQRIASIGNGRGCAAGLRHAF